MSQNFPSNGDLTKTDDLHLSDENRSEIEALTWALLDESIADEEFERLDDLLTKSEPARKQYLSCVQLHADLIGYFGSTATLEPPPAAAPRSPVLGFLSPAGLLPGDTNLPTEST